MSSLVFAMQYDWGISREEIVAYREALLSNAVSWYEAPKCLAKLG